MIGNVTLTTYSMKVFPATREMLLAYPHQELCQYAKSRGVKPGRTKAQTVDNLLRWGQATICGSLGD